MDDKHNKNLIVTCIISTTVIGTVTWIISTTVFGSATCIISTTGI